MSVKQQQPETCMVLTINHKLVGQRDGMLGSFY